MCKRRCLVTETNLEIIFFLSVYLHYIQYHLHIVQYFGDISQFLIQNITEQSSGYRTISQKIIGYKFYFINFFFVRKLEFVNLPFFYYYDMMK